MFLSLLLTGCVTRIAKPSDDYLKDCTIPYLKDGPAKGKDIVRLVKQRELALHECNLDKKALRAYYDELCRGYRNQCSDERTIFRRKLIKE